MAAAKKSSATKAAERVIAEVTGASESEPKSQVFESGAHSELKARLESLDTYLMNRAVAASDEPKNDREYEESAHTHMRKMLRATAIASSTRVQQIMRQRGRPRPWWTNKDSK